MNWGGIMPRICPITYWRSFGSRRRGRGRRRIQIQLVQEELFIPIVIIVILPRRGVDDEERSGGYFSAVYAAAEMVPKTVGLAAIITTTSVCVTPLGKYTPTAVLMEVVGGMLYKHASSHNMS